MPKIVDDGPDTADDLNAKILKIREELGVRDVPREEVDEMLGKPLADKEELSSLPCPVDDKAELRAKSKAEIAAKLGLTWGDDLLCLSARAGNLSQEEIDALLDEMCAVDDLPPRAKEFQRLQDEVEFYKGDAARLRQEKENAEMLANTFSNENKRIKRHSANLEKQLSDLYAALDSASIWRRLEYLFIGSCEVFR